LESGDDYLNDDALKNKNKKLKVNDYENDEKNENFDDDNVDNNNKKKSEEDLNNVLNKELDCFLEKNNSINNINESYKSNSFPIENNKISYLVQVIFFFVFCLFSFFLFYFYSIFLFIFI
jgi:hypothetical protein